VKERIGRDAALVGIGVSLVITLWSLSVIASALRPGVVGGDLHSYQEATHSWLAGEGFYRARQLAGPYQIVGAELQRVGADVLYPPTLLWLLVPFLVLPEALWWVVPGAMFGWGLWRLRPSIWGWLGVVVLLGLPPSLSILLYGNPVIWIVALTTLGLAYGWGGAFVLLKPSLLPFALLGITGRRWWLVAGLLMALTLPLLPLLLEYPRVLLDSRGGGLFYSLRDVPLLLVPLVAWLSSRTRNSSSSQLLPERTAAAI
jgi:hypothetical protein